MMLLKIFLKLKEFVMGFICGILFIIFIILAFVYGIIVSTKFYNKIKINPFIEWLVKELENNPDLLEKIQKKS
jgi:hypothetical protein